LRTLFLKRAYARKDFVKTLQWPLQSDLNYIEAYVSLTGCGIFRLSNQTQNHWKLYR